MENVSERTRQERFKCDIRKNGTGRKRPYHQMHTDIKFIKENLFNPHEGLWAETKQNSQFRKDTKKWRGVIGVGFVGLFIKQVYDLFT